ncbi:MAG: stage III sporulation protein AB [Clostridia bacterium]|nr:stage III sporulation protein AB [Clostridia bacterium]
MKIVLGILCLILCCFAGYLISAKYKDRLNFYLDFKNFNDNLKKEISFSQKTIKQILLEKQQNNSIFYTLISKNILSNENPTNKELYFLTKNEIDEVLTYITNVGNSDKNSQLTYLNNFESILNEKVNVVKEEEKKYKNLYIKIGFLIGLMLLIAFL